MYNFQHCVVSSDWRIPTAIMPDGGVPTAAWATGVTPSPTPTLPTTPMRPTTPLLPTPPTAPT